MDPQLPKKKKLTLKERMALKKKNKNKIKEFKPVERNLEEEKRLKLEKEKFKVDLERIYDLHLDKFNRIKDELSYFDEDNISKLSNSEKKEYMFLRAKMEALNKIDANRLEFFKQIFNQRELREVAENYKLYNKYMIMKNLFDTNNINLERFNTDYKNFCDFIDTFLGFKNENKNEIEDTLRQCKQKKKKVKEVVLEVVETFKKIEWKPEEDLNKDDLFEKFENSKQKLYDRSKEPLIIIFIGHVDSGKSTISGQILYLSGKINQLEIKKLKEEAIALGRESWWAAYIMDINKEERDKGKTVEMGRATFQTKKKRFTILDCPGHKSYVQNMISGAAQADVAGLVISARTGEFEAGFEKNGQTREHAMLARALGAQNLIVVVNKMDTCNWAESRFKYIKDRLDPFLKNYCGFDPKFVTYVCIEGLTGYNIKVREDKEVAKWYTGMTLFEAFDNLPKVQRSENKMIRIPVLSKVSLTGDLEVFGKIESGTIKPGMECIIMPLQTKLKIVEIQNEEDEKMAFAPTGESVKLIVKGIEEDAVKRGFVICGTQFWANVCDEFLAEIRVLELPKGYLLSSGFEFIVHMHTILQEAEILKVVSMIEREEGEKEKSTKSKFLKSQTIGTVIIKTKKPICLEKFQDFQELGKFAMRMQTYTVGIGKVLKFKPINKELLKKNYYFKKNN